MTVINRLAYHMRRLDWLVTNGFINTSTVKLDRPIFLLGNQGGGNTFLSRMIRRNSAVVSVGGGNDYWTSADEMQKVYSIPFRITCNE